MSARLWAGIAGAVFVIAALYIIVDVFRSQSDATLLKPDTAPGEYLYLDPNRVRSYLGQLVDGLPTSEKRTLAESEDLAADVKAGGAGISAARKKSSSTEAQVAPTVADRFYLLLRLLRAGKSKDENGHSHDWLVDVGSETKDQRRAYGSACGIREGDFVRIRNAHLLLSPYAAVLPKATYALLNRRTAKGLVARPTQRILAPQTRAQRQAVARYRRLLGKDPRLPFVVRTLSPEPGRGRSTGITFFIPARYRSLRNEPSLISGTLTIVGKVVYRNLSRPADEKRTRRTSCGLPVRADVPKNYLDRQTVATFVPALEAAPNFVFDNLRFEEGTIAEQVTANMTVAAPVIVVIPIAMYQ